MWRIKLIVGIRKEEIEAVDANNSDSERGINTNSDSHLLFTCGWKIAK
jgi:hypothetical protein